MPMDLPTVTIPKCDHDNLVSRSRYCKKPKFFGPLMLILYVVIASHGPRVQYASLTSLNRIRMALLLQSEYSYDWS